MNDVLEVKISGPQSETARLVLERIAWRGYVPPEAGDAEEVAWQLPVDQIDLIRSVLARNRRQAGPMPQHWAEIDAVCHAIAQESQRTGKRPRYGPDEVAP